MGSKFIRYTLGILLLIVALNAFGGGWYGMSGAPNVPLAWLEGSPFDSYFFPGLFLFTVIGGGCLFAAIAVFQKHPLARAAAVACCAIVFCWLAVQVAIIGYVSWMQPATAITMAVVLVFTLLMRGEPETA